MARKRWTPQTEITDTLIRFREKRKWQVSYRRYVLEKMPGEAYAPYFGLDIETLRSWFEEQFTEGLSWENFGKAWQFDHIVPSSYFDYTCESDLLLCWGFINLRVEKIETEKTKKNRIDPFAVRMYFQTLYQKTGYSLCLKMLDKIAGIELSALTAISAAEKFLMANQKLLSEISSLTHEEFLRLNEGMSANELLIERELLRKFS